ncbi:MAG TPA: GTP-binding protein, partial [Burkholderiales bacterium]
MQGQAPTLPLTVLGGYLGAGKTTLVNHLLRNAGGRRLAVLVNDFGALSIDETLIESREGNLLSIAGGCVCCSFGSDFMAGLMQMAALDPAPDHLLVETSGVALPGAVARSAALLQAIRVDAVVVLVDAETVRARAADRYLGDTVTRQLAEADLVLVNKVDLVDAAARPALKDWLAARAPRAGLLECERGRVAADVLLGLQRGAARATGALSGGAMRAPEDAAARYASAHFELDGRVDAQALAARLAAPALGLLRAKGIVRDADGRLVVLQLVGARVALDAAPVGARPGPL